jgi:excisionase family DNA binding protein
MWKNKNAIQLEEPKQSDERLQPEIIGSNIGELLTERELCDLLGIGATTAWRMRHDGEIRYRKVGRNVLFMREDVLEYLESQKY